MTPKFLGILSFSTLLVISANAAVANEVCAELDRLVTNSRTQLADLKGGIIPKDQEDEEGEDDCCYAKRNLPGAKFCTIKPTRFYDRGVVYTCFWNFESRKDLTSAVRPLIAAIKACLNEQVWQDESEGERTQFRAIVDDQQTLAKIVVEYSQNKRPGFTFEFEALPAGARRRKL